MEPPASGSSSKNKKPYYLTEAMQFTLPFIRALGTPVGNLSDHPQNSTMELTQDSADQTQNEVDNDEENSQSHVYNDLSPPFCPNQQPSCPIQIQQDNVYNEKTLSDTSEILPTSRKGKFQKRANTDVDKSFMEYLNIKKKKIETTSNECIQQKKMFLLSLLPEIEPMTNAQMSSFRRRVLQLIDDIMNPAPYQQLSLPPTYQHTQASSLISSHSSLTMDSSTNHSPQSNTSFNNPMSVEEKQHNDTESLYYQVVREALSTNNIE